MSALLNPSDKANHAVKLGSISAVTKAGFIFQCYRLSGIGSEALYIRL